MRGTTECNVQQKKNQNPKARKKNWSLEIF